MKNHLCAFFLGVLAASLVFGQSDARLVGTITDASGAVIPAAVITVENEKTGQSRKVQSNENGNFIASALLPSVYSMKVDAPGMATAEFKGLNLQAGQERVINVAMSPAATDKADHCASLRNDHHQSARNARRYPIVTSCHTPARQDQVRLRCLHPLTTGL